MIRAVLVAALLAIFACGDDETPFVAPTPTGVRPQDVPVRFRSAVAELAEVGGSGVTGQAKFVPYGNQSHRFTVELTPASGKRLADIHRGTCSAPGSVTEVLSEVVDGFSQTYSRRAIRGLVSGGFVVTVHESSDAGSPHVACGEIVESLQR